MTFCYSKKRYRKLTFFSEKIERYLTTRILVEENIVSSNSVFRYSKKGIIPDIVSYIAHVLYLTECEEYTILCALIYLGRFKNADPNVVAKSTICYLLFISIILSQKYNENQKEHKIDYTKIGNIKKGELFKLEMCFMKSVNYNLGIKEENEIQNIRNAVYI